MDYFFFTWYLICIWHTERKSMFCKCISSSSFGSRLDRMGWRKVWVWKCSFLFREKLGWWLPQKVVLGMCLSLSLVIWIGHGACIHCDCQFNFSVRLPTFSLKFFLEDRKPSVICSTSKFCGIQLQCLCYQYRWWKVNTCNRWEKDVQKPVCIIFYVKKIWHLKKNRISIAHSFRVLLFTP